MWVPVWDTNWIIVSRNPSRIRFPVGLNAGWGEPG